MTQAMGHQYSFRAAVVHSLEDICQMSNLRYQRGDWESAEVTQPMDELIGET